jgi:hypothetical protein
MVRWSPGGGQEEPDERQVERQGEGEDLLGVEFSAPVSVVGPFDSRDARLWQSLPEKRFEGLRGLLLSHST